MKRFTREQIRERLQARTAAGELIIACEAGVGIVAKMADIERADLILIDSVASFRMAGVDDAVAYRPYCDTNKKALELANRAQSVVEETPVIAGVAFADPYRNMDLFINGLLELGISGVANFPSVGPLPNSYRANIEKNNLGVKRETAYLKKCAENGIYTLGQGFYEDDIRAVAAAGIDMVCINMRFVLERATRPEIYDDPTAACDYVNNLRLAVKQENASAAVAVYGGPFETAQMVGKCFREAKIDAYISTKFTDELPMRSRITEAVREFADGDCAKRI